MTAVADTSPLAALVILLRALKLPTMARHADDVAQLAEREGWNFVRYLHHLVELEVHERRRRRIERNLRTSELPADKTLAMLNRSRLPARVAKMLPSLCDGAFVERGDNLLAFGLPGRGKTHVVCAIGHELIKRGYRVLFVATYALVQRLLAAKRDLRLEEELATLDGFDAVILDDIGYVQQNREEMEVLFTFLAERYERRTVMITSNLVFSEWDRIFKDPMTTAAAIDRLVHHSVILEMTGSSIRIEQAQAGRTNDGGNEPNHTDTVTVTTATDNPISGAAPTAPGPTATTTTATTTTPTTTTERPSNTPATPTTTPTTTHSIPGSAPTAPGLATAADQPSNKGASTNDRKQQIKQRVQQRRTEADGEM
ncbi:MAG: AAA family ATPase [Phycisphaerae bacterium]|nr:AAA family ATPase [Phycisphaerae bacterium]